MTKKKRSSSTPHKKVLRSRYDEMKQRCYNSNSSVYKHYGGRGIKVCDEWVNSFENFYKWSINNGFDPELTIDRINVNGNYEPSNCRWVSWEVQARNRTNNLIIEYEGKEYMVYQLSEMTGISEGTLYHRIKKGWTIPEILENPVNFYYIYLEHNGVTKTLSEWERECDIGASTLKKRMESGWSSYDILNEPINPCFTASKTMIYNGEEKTIKEWARIVNVDYETLWKRFYDGWSPHEVLYGRKRLSKNSRVKLTFNEETKELHEWANILNTNRRLMIDRYKKGYNDIDIIFGRREQKKKIETYLEKEK